MALAVRRVIGGDLCLERGKDEEDMQMIRRRAQLISAAATSTYSPHQFMLHKDDFVEHSAATPRASLHVD